MFHIIKGWTDFLKWYFSIQRFRDIPGVLLSPFFILKIFFLARNEKRWIKINCFENPRNQKKTTVCWNRTHQSKREWYSFVPFGYYYVLESNHCNSPYVISLYASRIYSSLIVFLLLYDPNLNRSIERKLVPDSKSRIWDHPYRGKERKKLTVWNLLQDSSIRSA